MTDKNAIKVISGLLKTPSSANEGTKKLVAGFRQKYPYFIPARYIRAAGSHKKKAYSTDMLTAAYPYTGNWLLFLDHINGVVKPVTKKIQIVAPEAEEMELPVSETIIAIEQEDVLSVEPPIAEEPFVVEPEQDMIVEPEVIDAEHEVIEDIEQERVEETIEKIVMTDVKEELKEEIIPEPEVISNEQAKAEEHLFMPSQSDDYFMQQGIKISRDMPDNIDEFKVKAEEDSVEKSLMVMMSFTEWLLHFKNTSERKNADLEDQKAVRTMWQKEKLAAALEEENDEIPENVFEMAVNSIAKEEGLASESLADIHMKQGKYDQAIEMYKKLSLRNPQKNAYFARKIQEVLKEKRS